MKPTSLLAHFRAGFPALLTVVLVLAACRQEPPPEPVVDMTPVGDALRFLGVAFVLGTLVRCVAGLRKKP